jgi:hypothetical protein
MKRVLAALGFGLLVVAIGIWLLEPMKTQQAAPERVIVKFPVSRPVYIDTERVGNTNEVLPVDRGTHQFDLGPGADYRPASQKFFVKDTTVLVPLVIEFQRIP